MPLSCSSSCPIHGPNGCNCIPSQGQRYHDERSQLHQPTPPANATILTSHPGPLACAAPAAFTNSYIHFPDLHGSGYGTIAFSQHSDSQLNVPSQCLSFPLAPPAEPPEQNSGDGMATPSLTRKGKRKSTATKSNPQQPPRKRPRVPAVPTTEPPSSICGVGPPTTVESSSPPATPARSVAGKCHSTSASFRPPVPKRRATEQPVAATDVWYFCRPEDSPTKSVERPPPDQDQRLTRRPKAKYISCKLCA
jgi:hypothetical protein